MSLRIVRPFSESWMMETANVRWMSSLGEFSGAKARKGLMLLCEFTHRFPEEV